MRLATVRLDGEWRGGVERGGEVIALGALPAARERGALTVKGLLGQGPGVLDAVLADAAGALDAGREVASLGDLEVGPAVPDPDKVLLLGLNYAASAAQAGAAVPSAPNVYGKFRSSLVGHGAPIVLPEAAGTVFYEGELAVVIGARCKGAAEDEALGFVAGYSVFNDVTLRELQLPWGERIQLKPSQQIVGKGVDTFGPLGPAIALARDVGDPQDLRLTTRLNGEVVQRDTTATMLFSVARAIALLSSVITLEPGDVIATGTPPGFGPLAHGDVVEIDIERVGVLRNPVLAAGG